MSQLGMDMGFERDSNDQLEGRSGVDTPYPESYGEDHLHLDSRPSIGIGIEDEGENFRYRGQLCALKEQLRALKEVIVESGGTFTDHFGCSRPELPGTSQKQPSESDRENLYEVARDHDLYFVRVQNLERRVGELLSSSPGEGNAGFQDRIARRDSATITHDRISHDIHHEHDHLSHIRSLDINSDSKSTLPEILAELEAAKAEITNVEADRDAILEENDDLGQRLNKLQLEYESIVQQDNSLRIHSQRLEGQRQTLEERGFDVREVEDVEGAVRRMELQENRDGQHSSTSSSLRPSLKENYESHLLLIRTERDSAIQQNEEARRTLATRTAERNGAHQRMHILEAAVKESHVREAQLQAEIHRREKQEQTQANLLNIETKTYEAERPNIDFLQEELEHAVAAAAKAQHEHDAARAEIRTLEMEIAVANSAAETANGVVTELQQSLGAANHAALAEREKAEESRRTQNRLRIERETVRIEVAKLQRELNAAHQISKGLVRHGNVTVGDLLHIREEKDAALTRLSSLEDELDKANDTARELQQALDDSLERQGNGTINDLGLEEFNRIVAQRDEALAHVKELERLLKELEDDYRKNLDQWERQTQRDEKEINASKRFLEAEKKRINDLSDELKATKTKLQEAETRARIADDRTEVAEERSETFQILVQQIELDLEHSNEDRDELEDTCNRLRDECLRLSGMITAARNEVLRLGGNVIAPDGTVQGGDVWPRGSLSLNLGLDPRNIPRLPTPDPEAIPEYPDEEGYVSFPYPTNRPSVDKSTRTQGPISRPSISSSGKTSSSSQQQSPLHSPFPSPRQRPPTAGLPSRPLLQTGPTMSTQTCPRSSRNPAPDYGAPSGSRSRKRKLHPFSEMQGSSKRRKLSK